MYSMLVITARGFILFSLKKKKKMSANDRRPTHAVVYIIASLLCRNKRRIKNNFNGSRTQI